jgi:hypothetical protein
LANFRPKKFAWANFGLNFWLGQFLANLFGWTNFYPNIYGLAQFLAKNFWFAIFQSKTFFSKDNVYLMQFKWGSFNQYIVWLSLEIRRLFLSRISLLLNLVKHAPKMFSNLL